jgi:hypothetical protein
MIRQNENRLPQLLTNPLWRHEGPPIQLSSAASPSPGRRARRPEKGPTFLKTYVVPMLLFNLAAVGWTLVNREIAQGMMIYLGYALIVAIGLRLYLVYLDHYLFGASSGQIGMKVQPSTRDQDHRESERWHDAPQISAAPGPERRQPGQLRAEVLR